MEKEKTISKEELKEILKTKDAILVLNDAQFKQFLEKTGNAISEDGHVIDKATGKVEEFKNLDPIQYPELGGVFSGSKVFIRENVADLSEYLTEHYKRRPSDDQR